MCASKLKEKRRNSKCLSLQNFLHHTRLALNYFSLFIITVLKPTPRLKDSFKPNLEPIWYAGWCGSGRATSVLCVAPRGGGRFRAVAAAPAALTRADLAGRSVPPPLRHPPPLPAAGPPPTPPAQVISANGRGSIMLTLLPDRLRQCRLQWWG